MLHQNEKPKALKDNLGIDVKLETKVLESDQWAMNTLAEVGKILKQGEHEYLGSVAIHYYKSPGAILASSYEVQTIQQIHIGDLNEYIALMGIQNLTIEMKKRYGRSTKTLDKNDKRGE